MHCCLLCLLAAHRLTCGGVSVLLLLLLLLAVPVPARLDVSMRLAPEALVGRHLRVYWDNDDAWFAGSVVEWDEGTGRHKVRGRVQHARTAMTDRVIAGRLVGESLTPRWQH